MQQSKLSKFQYRSIFSSYANSPEGDGALVARYALMAVCNVIMFTGL